MSSYSKIINSKKELEWSDEFREHKKMILDFMERFYDSEYPVVVTESFDDSHHILFKGKSRTVRIFEPEADGNFETVKILVNETKELEFASPQYFVCTWKDAGKDELWRYFDGTVKDNRHLQMLEELLILMDKMKQALTEGVDFSPTSIISLVTQTLGITEDKIKCFESPVLTIHESEIVDAKKKNGHSLLELERTDCVTYENGNFKMTENESKQIIGEVRLSSIASNDCPKVFDICFKEGREAIILFLQEIATYNKTK